MISLLEFIGFFLTLRLGLGFLFLNGVYDAFLIVTGLINVILEVLFFGKDHFGTFVVVVITVVCLLNHGSVKRFTPFETIFEAVVVGVVEVLVLLVVVVVLFVVVVVLIVVVVVLLVVVVVLLVVVVVANVVGIVVLLFSIFLTIDG